MELLDQLKTSTGDVYVSLYWDEKNKVISDVWDGAFGSQENFRRALTRITELMEDKGAKRWLADIRNMKGSFDSSSDFIAKEITPKTVQLGVTREAIIQPSFVFAKLSTKDTVMKIEKLEIRQFEDYNEGYEWLVSDVAVPA
ncbi:hypothetical protein AB9P05_20135 [Roseivirga sp. BDSF3-8]|uniref:hypothetical protein n=1 Tax=Roseivirga sp. BDSF3-8 TaxID=3241598 RepID=UPI0035324252